MTERVRLPGGDWIGIRRYEDRDRNLILNSWCKQIRRCEPFRSLPDAAFKAHKVDTLEPVLDRSEKLIACDPEHPWHVFGYWVGEVRNDTRAMHMLYVKYPYRRNGIGATLLGIAFPSLAEKNPPRVYYTYPTRAAKHCEKRWHLIYAPSLA